MSIETLLTLGLAAAILVIAALLRFVILGVVRVGFRLSGRDVPWLQPRHHAAGHTSGAPRDPVWRRLAHSGRAAVGAVGFIAAGFLEGLTIAVVGLTRAVGLAVTAAAPWLRGAGRSLATAATTTAAAVTAGGTAVAPRARGAVGAARRGTRSAVAAVKTFLILAAATTQHVARVVIARVRRWVEQHEEERSTRPGEPTAAGDGPRVIDLDHTFDPLTDDFPEDRVGSSI